MTPMMIARDRFETALRISALAALLLLAARPVHAGVTSDDVLTGQNLPASPDVLPESVTLPDQWIPTMREMWAATESIGHEQGACLYHGTASSQTQSMTARLIELNEVTKKRVAAQKAGDQALAAELAGKEAALHKGLETAATAPAKTEFEVVRVTQGISMSVEVPTCIGSAIGTIHTHPRFTTGGGDQLMPIPSDGDFVFGIQTAIVENQRYQLVVAGDRAVLMVYTGETMRFKEERTVSVKNAETEEIGSLWRLAEDGVPFTFDALLPRIAALAGKVGAVLYAGRWPMLQRVHPSPAFNGRYIQYRNGEFTLAPASPESDLLGTLQVMIHFDPSASPSAWWFLRQTTPGRELLANWKPAQEGQMSPFEVPFVPESFATAHDFYQGLSEDEKIAVLGFGWSRLDIRFIAEKDNVAYPVGPCLLRYSEQGQARLELYAQCTSDTTQRLTITKCKGFARDQAVAWEWSNNASRLTIHTSNGDATCRSESYNYTNGRLGALMSRSN
jgi:hypothetical protein